MILLNDKFKVEIKKETQYTPFSRDNQYYDYIINIEDYNINGDKLILTDFNGDIYKVDKYGKEIKDS
ncbi:hypothetical protein [Clostridium cadaveris]|uniref:hypothetical protein n=1 Tax=Clostridium cadaveris TaxID=1529 RepID=UPI003990EE2F